MKYPLFKKMFQGSPECQLSIINLLIPVVLKVKSKICGSMDYQLSRGEDQKGLRRVGEAEAVDKRRMCRNSSDDGY